MLRRGQAKAGNADASEKACHPQEEGETMKRNMNVVLALLEHYEFGLPLSKAVMAYYESSLPPDEMASVEDIGAERKYLTSHESMLRTAGFIVFDDDKMAGIRPHRLVLTWAGYDLLDSLRAKETRKKKGKK